MKPKDFLIIIKRRLWFLILVTLLTTGITYAITKFFIQPQYRASALIIIGNNDISSSNSLKNSDSYEDLALTYAQFASTRKVAEDVVRSLKLNMSATSLQSMIVAMPSKDSRFLTISITSTDKNIVAPVANQVIISLKSVTKDLVPPDTIQVIDEALAPSYPFSPNTKLNMIAAFFLGIMLSIGIIFLLEYTDSTIKNEDELSELLDAPVLGVIPSSSK